MEKEEFLDNLALSKTLCRRPIRYCVNLPVGGKDRAFRNADLVYDSGCALQIRAASRLVGIIPTPIRGFRTPRLAKWAACQSVMLRCMHCHSVMTSGLSLGRHLFCG